jgi:hypothetical protein
MVKCVDKGKWTCISQKGFPKKPYDSDKLAIEAAKKVNESNPDSLTKLVAYKCSHCHKYHLMSVYKKIKNGR